MRFILSRLNCMQCHIVHFVTPKLQVPYNSLCHVISFLSFLQCCLTHQSFTTISGYRRAVHFIIHHLTLCKSHQYIPRHQCSQTYFILQFHLLKMTNIPRHQRSQTHFILQFHLLEMTNIRRSKKDFVQLPKELLRQVLLIKQLYW